MRKQKAHSDPEAKAAQKAEKDQKRAADKAAREQRRADSQKKAHADKLEYEKRIRIVQEWLIEDWPYTDIVQQIMLKWGIEDRQAKRYVAEARTRWVADEQEALDHKRRLKIHSLKKLKRSLRDSFKGTPAGIRAIMHVEKEIINLEGFRPAKKFELTGKDGKDLPLNNVTTVVVIKNPHDDSNK
jgi:hypothetical protein